MGNASFCTAFPEGIPREVLSEEVLHFNKMENQIGDFVFEPIEHEKHYKKYFEYIKELVSKRNQIEEEIVALANEIIENSNAKNSTPFTRGEIQIHRSKSKMIRKADEILLFDSGGKPELISMGFDSALFKKLNSILLMECVENHKTDLKFIIRSNGNYEFNFSNLTLTERKRQYALISMIHNQRAKNRLMDEGLSAISSENLSTEIKVILEKEDKNDLPRDKEILDTLRKKGFAVLEIEVTKLRRELGLKSKRELRIERLKKAH